MAMLISYQIFWGHLRMYECRLTYYKVEVTEFLFFLKRNHCKIINHNKTACSNVLYFLFHQNGSIHTVVVIFPILYGLVSEKENVTQL